MRDQISLLKSEARRRPEIADMIERIHEFTVEDIDAFKFPLPWYRVAMKKIKAASDRAVLETALEPLMVEMHIEHSGTTRRYTGETRFVTVDRGGMIEVQEGMLLWFPVKQGGVFMNYSIYSKYIDPAFMSSQYVGTMTRAEYHKAYSAMLQGQLQYTDLPIIDMTGGAAAGSAAPTGVRAIPGVRIG